MTSAGQRAPVGRYSASTSRSGVNFGSSGAPHKPGSRIENTYRLEPACDFPKSQVRRIIEEVVTRHLEGKTYSAQEANALTVDLANKIKQAVKAVLFNRYKLIVFVLIGECHGTSAKFASRCVWNENFDTFVDHSYSNGSMYASCTAYGVYQE